MSSFFTFSFTFRAFSDACSHCHVAQPPQLYFPYPSYPRKIAQRETGLLGLNSHSLECAASMLCLFVGAVWCVAMWYQIRHPLVCPCLVSQASVQGARCSSCFMCDTAFKSTHIAVVCTYTGFTFICLFWWIPPGPCVSDELDCARFQYCLHRHLLLRGGLEWSESPCFIDGLRDLREHKTPSCPQ